jgi:hypothetical protein
MVREGKCRRAMGRIIGVSEVQHHGGGRLGSAGEAVVDQRVGEPGKSLAVDTISKLADLLNATHFPMLWHVTEPVYTEGLEAD